MDRLTSVEWLRMKADGFYNVFEQERFLEAADEIERLREALNLVVVYWDKWMGRDDDPLALSLEEVVLIARSALQQKDSE